MEEKSGVVPLIT